MTAADGTDWFLERNTEKWDNNDVSKLKDGKAKQAVVLGQTSLQSRCP